MGCIDSKAVRVKNQRLIKRLLLAVVVLCVLAIIVVLIGYRRVSQDPEVLLSQIQKQADMHLRKIRQTATKNGIREWRMEAESATLLKKKQTMLLVKPIVEVFMADGDHVHLTADEGIIYTDSNRLAVSGNVVAKNRVYQVNTDSIDYNPTTRELRADQPVTITSQSATLTANTMAMDLTTNITRFEGGVKGTISEDLQL